MMKPDNDLKFGSRAAAVIGVALFLASTLAITPKAQAAPDAPQAACYCDPCNAKAAQCAAQWIDTVWNLACNPIILTAQPASSEAESSEPSGPAYEVRDCQNVDDWVNYADGLADYARDFADDPCGAHECLQACGSGQVGEVVDGVRGCVNPPTYSLCSSGAGVVVNGKAYCTSTGPITDLVNFADDFAAACTQSAPTYDPLANGGNIGYLNGGATFTVGGIVTVTQPPCDGNLLEAPTPLIPAGADLGGITTPPFDLPYVASEGGCSHYGTVGADWHYNFTMAISIGGAVYDGALPFSFDSSHVEIHVEPKTIPQNSKGVGYNLKETCEAAEALEKLAVAQSLLVQANAYVKSKPWPTDGVIRYVLMSNGSWFLEFPGKGLATLDYAASVGQNLAFIGTAKFSFTAEWTVAQLCNSTTRVCAAGVAQEHGENLLTN